jgi:hypothetical protein
MSTRARTPQRSRIHRDKKTVMTATAAAGSHIRERQLEESVSWTVRERMRLLWYRLPLTIQEMNYATRRLAELQSRLR